MENIPAFFGDQTFLSEVYSIVENTSHAVIRGKEMYPSEDQDDDLSRGRKRPDIDDIDDDDIDTKQLRLMSAEDQRKYLKENHSQIEKRRRDKMNTYIKELCNLIPACKAMSRKTDKLTILRLAVQHMKTLRGSLDSYTEGNYKPPILTDKELKQLILPRSDGFMFVVDTARGRLLFVSESVQETLSFTSQDLTGQSLFDIVHPKDISKVKEQLTNIDSTPRERLIDSKTMLPLDSGAGEVASSIARFHPGARRAFLCRMKCRGAGGGVKQEEESLANLTTSTASSSSGSGKKRKSGGGGEKKYLAIQCTGYLKSWPMSKVGLHADYSESDNYEESSMSCLVAVARIQPSYRVAIEDSLERGQSRAAGVEFISRHGPDGKFSFVDQRVSLVLGYTPQELLGTSLYEHIQFDDIPALAEAHRNVLKKNEEICTPYFRFRTKDGSFVKLESKWKQFRNPWTKEIEYLISKNVLLISNEKEDEGRSYTDSDDMNFFSKSGTSSAEPSRQSPPGRDIQRVITNYTDAAKIGRKIADEAREDWSASNSPMSVSSPQSQSGDQKSSSLITEKSSRLSLATAMAEVEQDRSKLGGVIVNSKKSSTCPTSTAATTSRGGKGTSGAPLSLSEQIMQGAANAKRHSPQSSSASSEGNDDAAMAVIMSLLEADAGLGGPVDFSGLPWPLP